MDFGNYISAIYPSELELKDTSTSSTEVCYLDTNIKTGENTPFRISIYDKREDFAFRIVNFPHMDSNIPANPAYGVYISQLVRYARICTSKVDFINRLRGLSIRLRQQGFDTNLLQKSFNKFFSCHGLIVEKYGAALRGMRLAIQAWIAPSYPYITYLLLSVVYSFILVGVRVQVYFEREHYLFIYLTCTLSSFINVLILLCVIFLPYRCCPWLCSHGGWLLLKCSAISIGFNGAETNCGIARILGILLMNSCDT